ncbi:hypothetical protein [Tunicatimonas pelagia]|uniref:hypothetical protein n=1 Tax=Tunicatimonas pelagia TaxID=931531 RepID=UPI0026665CD4|nr:hypothetical protein [Tunicatimonas pelagia]WKN40525.1 hypothetical protein P0M28_15905 [Tunicatimonas pelagia]
MKYTFLPLLFVFLWSCSSLNRYYLYDEGTNKTFLTETISDLSKDGKISKKPILVIDGIEYIKPRNIDLVGLKLTKKEIKEIELLKEDAALRIFGNSGKRGVLVITTKKGSKEENHKDSKKI